MGEVLQPAFTRAEVRWISEDRDRPFCLLLLENTYLIKPNSDPKKEASIIIPDSRLVHPSNMNPGTTIEKKMRRSKGLCATTPCIPCAHP
jgi:hypothetical protein